MPARTYLYKLTSDRGGAPCAPDLVSLNLASENILTLAICKPAIRRTAQPGDRIIGITSRSLQLSQGYPANAVLYAAIVREAVDAREYYASDGEREQGQVSFRSRPDCIYQFHRDAGRLTHIGSTPLHSAPEHLRKDIGQYPYYRNGRTLISGDFRYFGSAAIALSPRLPLLLEMAETLGQGHRVFLHKPGDKTAVDRELDALFRQLWKLPSRHTPAEVDSESYDHMPKKRRVPKKDRDSPRLGSDESSAMT